MALKSEQLSDADSDAEWLEWIGKCVCIKGIKYGTLYFYGKTQFADGKWCGVELNEPIGKNDGAVAGVRYFCCKPHHGIFAPASKVEKVDVTSPRHDQVPEIIPARNKKSQVPLPKKLYSENNVPNHIEEEYHPDVEESKILVKTSRSRSLNYPSKIPHRSYLARRKEREVAKLHHQQQENFTNHITSSKPPIGGYSSLEEETQPTIPEWTSNDAQSFSSIFLNYDLNLTTYQNNLIIFDKLVQDLSVDILAVTDSSQILDDLEISAPRSKSCENLPTHLETYDVVDAQPHCHNGRLFTHLLPQHDESVKPFQNQLCPTLPCCDSETNSNVLFPLPKNLFPEETNLMSSELERMAETNEKEYNNEDEFNKTIGHKLTHRTISEAYRLNKFYQQNSSLCRFRSLPFLECDWSSVLNGSVRASLTRTYSAPSLLYWTQVQDKEVKIEDLNASIYDSLEGTNLNSSFRRECSEDEDKMTSSKERPASTYTVSSTDTGYQEELGGLTEDSTPVDGHELPFGRLADDLSRRLASRAEEFFQGMNDSGGYSMIEGEREPEPAPCPLSSAPETNNGAQEETTLGSASPQSTVSTTLTLEDVREAGQTEAPQKTKGPPQQTSTQRPRPLTDTNKARPPPATSRVKSRPFPAGRQSVVSAAPASGRTKEKEDDTKENKPLTTSIRKCPNYRLLKKKEPQKAAEEPKLARLKPTGPPPATRGALVKPRDGGPKPPPPPAAKPSRPSTQPQTRTPAPVALRARPAPRPALTRPSVPKPAVPAPRPSGLVKPSTPARPASFQAKPAPSQAKPAHSQAKPAPRGPQRPSVTITDYKRPPLWMSKADLSKEIQHLEAQCEARTKQLRVVKTQLHQATQGFDAFAILINYLTDDLDAFSNPRLLRDIQDAQQKLLASNLQIAYHKKELDELKKKNDGELQNVNHMLDLAHRNEIKTVQEMHAEQMKSLQLQHESEIAALEEKQKTILQESDVRFQKIIDELNREHQTAVQSMEVSHQESLDHASQSYQHRQQELQAQLEEVQKQYDSLHSQVQKAELVLQKGIDSKIQWINAKRTDLEQEVESLQSVMEMKNNEICRLRSENNEMKKELEDLPILKEKIKKLKAREEDLVALVEEKTKLQRQMSQEHQQTATCYQREAQTSKRLTLENEELQWKLRCMEASLMSSPTTPVLRE